LALHRDRRFSYQHQGSCSNRGRFWNEIGPFQQSNQSVPIQIFQGFWRIIHAV